LARTPERVDRTVGVPLVAVRFAPASVAGDVFGLGNPFGPLFPFPVFVRVLAPILALLLASAFPATRVASVPRLPAPVEGVQRLLGTTDAAALLVHPLPHVVRLGWWVQIRHECPPSSAVLSAAMRRKSTTGAEVADSPDRSGSMNVPK
jgi:hypothetical protein